MPRAAVPELRRSVRRPGRAAPTVAVGALGAAGWVAAIVDYHVIHALVLIAVAATDAGDHFGLGRVWARLPFVRRFHAILR